jgi:glycosyltransferase involved in cell wall biosynthesis
MKPPLRVIFVNRFYWPDEPATAQLLTDLAESLAATGIAVTVVTSHPGRPGIPPREIHRGVEIIRVRSPRLGRKNLLKRALDFATFIRGARREVARCARPGDTLVAMTDPPLLGAALAGIAKKKALRLIHWVQDVFPEVAMAVGHRFTSLVLGWRDRAWLAADACVVLGTDMAGQLRARGVPENRIHLCPNWSPRGLTAQPADAAHDLRADWDLVGKFVVLYSGNLGRVHDFSAIVPLAKALIDDPEIVFVFVGDGARRPPLESAVREQRLTNVRFFPAQPRQRLAETLALGDVHLVTLRAGCERLVFPSKLYGITAVGRPVIFIGPRDCEVARTIESQFFGYAFARDAVHELADALTALRANPAQCENLARHAVDFFERGGGLDAAVRRWKTLLERKPLAEVSPEASP